MRRVALFALIVGLGLVGCADEDRPLHETAADAGGDVDAEGTATLNEQPDAPLRFGVTFEARFDDDAGTIEFFNVERFAEGSSVRRGDLVTIAQAGYCVHPNATGDGVGTGPENTLEIYSEPGSTRNNEDCFGGAYPEPYYHLFGARCTDVTIRSFYDIPLNGVHAQIDEMVPAEGNLGYAFPSGTGAEPQPGLSNVFGLWSYGDLGPADGHMGPPYGVRPDENTVTWLFENDERPYYFSGRILAEATEVCGDRIDNDCDGLADEGCATGDVGDFCNYHEDCRSGFCEVSGFCGESTCENGLHDGSESDVDCGGTCDTCGLSEGCSDHDDCASGACRMGICDTLRWPAAGDVVITEFMADPARVPDAQGEWVEFSYVGNERATVEGCTLRDEGTDSHRLVGSLELSSGDTLVVARTASVEVNGGIVADYALSASERPTGIRQSGEVRTDTIGRSSGGEARLDICPPGTVLVGVDGMESSFLHAYTAICGEYALVDEPDGFRVETTRSTTTLTMRGGVHTRPAYSDRCPDGQLIRSLYGEDGWYANRVGYGCDTVSVGESLGTYGLYYERGLQGPLHGESSGPAVRYECPDGMVAVGIFGRTGHWVDQTGLVCSELRLDVPASFTLTNATDDEIVLECGGTVIDEVRFDSDDVRPGAATQLSAETSTATANDDMGHFCFATDTYGAGDLGSPGERNQECDLPIAACRLDTPPRLQMIPGETRPVRAQVYVPGLSDYTRYTDPSAGLRAQVGFGPADVMPEVDPFAWEWTEAEPDLRFDAVPWDGRGDWDQYTAMLMAPDTVGESYAVAYRVTGNNGYDWTYCDRDGTSVTYTPAEAATLEVIPEAFEPGAYGDVVFSEVMPRSSSGDDNGEWFELYNTTEQSVDVSGCVIETDGAAMTLPIGTLIGADAYLVVGRSDVDSENFRLRPDVTYGDALNLSNTGGSLRLSCAGVSDEAGVDTFRYEAREVSLGASINVLSGHLDADGNDDTAFRCTTPSTWIYGTPTRVGTPGEANSPCLDVDACRLLRPVSERVAPGEEVRAIAYIRVDGVTDITNRVNPDPMIVVEVGVGPDGADPELDQEGWAWEPLHPNESWIAVVPNQDDDEYVGSITAPAITGGYDVYARVSTDGGRTYVSYCNREAGGVAAYEAGEVRVFDDAFALLDETIATGSVGTCALNPDRTVSCWGSIWGSDPPAGGGFDAIVGTGSAYCTVSEDGTYNCFGSNTYGEQEYPAGLSQVDTLSARQFQVCAVDPSQKLWCWGHEDEWGYSSVPTGHDDVQQVTTGTWHTCALHADGEVTCFGRDICSAVSSTPDSFSSRVVAIDAGHIHTCALLEDGRVECWGGCSTPRANPPADLPPITQISAGYDHTCGVTVERTVRCWGVGEAMEVPDDLGPVREVRGFNNNVCVRLEDDSVRCWGYNRHGQSDVPD